MPHQIGAQGVAFGQVDDLGTPVSHSSRGSIARPAPAAPQRFACRLAATDAWFAEEVAVTLSSCRDFHPATSHQLAWRTNLSGQVPKQSMKDCVILATCLEHIRSLRAGGRTATAVFVSSSTRDCAAADRTTIGDDIKGEFHPPGLE